MKKYLMFLLVFAVSAASLCAAPASLGDKVSSKMKKPHKLFSSALTGEVALLLDNQETVTRPAVRIGKKMLMGYGSGKSNVVRLCVEGPKGKQCVLPDFEDESEGFFLAYIKRGDLVLNDKMQIVPVFVAPDDMIARLEDTFVVVNGKKRAVTLVGETASGVHSYAVRGDASAGLGTPLFGTYVNEDGVRQGPVLLGFKAESGEYEFWVSEAHNDYDVIITDFTAVEYEEENEEIIENIRREKLGESYKDNETNITPESPLSKQTEPVSGKQTEINK